MTKIIGVTALAAAIGLTSAGAGLARPASPRPTDAEIARVKGILDAEHPQFGDVRLRGPDVTLHLGRRYYFLGADEAKQVLKEWGNPPDATDDVLGIIFPAGKTFVSDTWGAVVTFEPSGFVTDKDADKADYDKIIRDAQDREAEQNAELQKQGFATSHLVGWAQPPSYDKQRHALIWARDIKFSGQDADALNYDVRILGRRGVLSVNLVSTMPELTQVRADAAALAGDVSFNSGSAYGDFQAGKDKTAEYGIAGLVAAGLGVAAAQKLGLFAVLLVIVKKALVFVVAGFAAIAARFRRLFNRRPKTAEPARSDAASADDQPRDAA
jgi:uncharacterized membrane-anchored protein